MKFGKDFKKQMVPEWAEAYMDYNGLKRILREVREYKQRKQPVTLSKDLEQKPPPPDRAFSGLELQSSSLQDKGDVEDQVIDVNTLRSDGSNQFYKTKFLRQSEEGGEIEATFFRKLDEELNKVNTFYKDKVEEVKQEESLLDKQMDALVALRIKVKNPDQGGSNPRRHSNSAVSLASYTSSGSGSSGTEPMGLTYEIKANDKDQRERFPGELEVNPTHINNSSSDSREMLNNYGHKEDPLEVLERVRINNTLESPISTIKGVFKDSKEEELSFDKDELRSVEGRLRVAFIEFYHKLQLLKHYSFMNLSAFSKIMKKYEKFTSRRASRSYMLIVDNSNIGSSDEVTNLLERVEAAFIKKFSDSNRRKAMKSLRAKERKEKHIVTFLSGFFSGCSIALLVAIVLKMEAQKHVDNKEGKRYMENIFPLYSIFGYITLHMIMYAANIYFWRRYRVNYPFIFGFKKGTELGYRDVFLLSTGLAVLALGGFLANLHLDMDSSAQKYQKVTKLVPLCLLILVLFITFCPFNIVYRSSRFFFIQCLFRCLCAPLYPETLPDFFLADQLTSQMQALRSFVLYICYYGLGEYSRMQSKCHKHGVYNTLYFIIAVIPYWMRFLQCIRRLCEEKDLKHMYNGLKYFSTIVAVIIRTAYELKKGMTWMMLALISSAVATMINTYWDIVVDWGLLRKNSKNKYLRDRLLVSHKSIYFAAMVLDIVLRLAWMQLVLEFKLPSLYKMTITTIISCLEIIRRGVWSFFRLENEHLNNVGEYRAFKSVPLPFSYYDEDGDKDD